MNAEVFDNICVMYARLRLFCAFRCEIPIFASAFSGWVLEDGIGGVLFRKTIILYFTETKENITIPSIGMFHMCAIVIEIVY